MRNGSNKRKNKPELPLSNKKPTASATDSTKTCKLVTTKANSLNKRTRYTSAKCKTLRLKRSTRHCKKLSKCRERILSHSMSNRRPVTREPVLWSKLLLEKQWILNVPRKSQDRGPKRKLKLCKTELESKTLRWTSWKKSTKSGFRIWRPSKRTRLSEKATIGCKKWPHYFEIKDIPDFETVKWDCIDCD